MTVLVGVVALAASAYLPPVAERDGVTIRIAGFEEETGDSKLKEGISLCASFAGLMKQIPPMVRIAIANLICRGLGESEGSSFWNRRIHYSLGYGERACQET